MAVTHADIAKLSRVSRPTVSQVLRSPSNPRFPEATRQRVLEAAAQLEYVPNRLASGMREGRTYTLGLIMPYNVPELMDTAEQVATGLGYTLQIQFTYQPDVAAEERALQAVLERRVDGIIWQPTGLVESYDKLLPQIRNSGVALVLLERSLPGLEQADLVYSDTEAGSRQAVHHFQEQGYSHIVYVVRSLTYPLRQQRLAEFQALAPEATYLELKPSDDARARIADCLRATSSPVALYCDSDFDSLAAVRAAEDIGRVVPAEVGVLGLSDMLVGGSMRFGEISTPTISSVRRHHHRIGRRCAELLHEQLEGDHRGSEASREHCAIQPTLIQRVSTSRNDLG
jgi:LacI family transcriptional regulator